LVRLVLSLGLVLGFGAVGTMASWSDSARVTTGSFATGELDLQVGATQADQLDDQGGTWNHATFGLTDMVPSEGVAKPLIIRNTGSTPLTYTAVASATGTAFEGQLLLTVVKDGVPGDAAGQTLGNRRGTCSGGTAWTTDLALGQTPKPLRAQPVALDPGASTTLCVKAALSSSAPQTLQNMTTSVTLLITAAQPHP
jgi:predicted ribosomally synthesized peptide with SipW-like signal peptide